jgi:hypothetical protein
MALGIVFVFGVLYGEFQQLHANDDVLGYLSFWLFLLCGILSLCGTPFVVGGLTYRALGRPKKEAMRFIGFTAISALTVIFGGLVALAITLRTSSPARPAPRTPLKTTVVPPPPPPPALPSNALP